MRKIVTISCLALLFWGATKVEVKRVTAFSFEERKLNFYKTVEIQTEHQIRVAKSYPRNAKAPIFTVIGYLENVWYVCNVPVEVSNYRQEFNREATLPNGKRVFWK